MDSDTERLLEYLDNDDYDGARNYAERHACESDALSIGTKTLMKLMCFTVLAVNVASMNREIQIAGSSC